MTTTTKIAGEAMQITDEFKDWFEREWSSYQDKAISGGKIMSMTWALKGYRALLASKAAVAHDDEALRTLALSIMGRSPKHEENIVGAMNLIRNAMIAASTAPAQSCGDAEQADAPQAVEQWQFRVKDVGSPFWTNITHADANELSSNPAFELRALSLVSPLPRASEQADEAVTLPQAVLDALRFYANGHHYNIDEDHQQFDTVSGEPQNWLFSERDDDCTMIEDGRIAKAVLQGIATAFEEPSPPIEGEVFAARAKGSK